MRTLPALLILTLLLSGCITVETQTPTPILFVTSTLPAHSAVTPTPSLTPTPEGALPRPTGCTDAAVLLQETIPDGTRVAAGQSFTKKWSLRNMGTCPWDPTYQLVFIAGEKMSSPDSIPLPVTAPKQDAEISVDLVAPSSDGSYTGIYELRDPGGNVISIGLEKTIWVKITVGAGAPVIPSATEAGTTTGGVTPVSTVANCSASENAGYVNQLLTLINSARRSAGLAALTVNAQLTAAAQGHSRDMACNNFLGHVGSDGSTIGQRILAAGYTPTGFVEIIAIGTPQDAMSQWQNDAGHWEAVLNPGDTEIGIGYAYNANSDYGGYFTVDMAAR